MKSKHVNLTKLNNMKPRHYTKEMFIGKIVVVAGQEVTISDEIASCISGSCNAILVKLDLLKK